MSSNINQVKYGAVISYVTIGFYILSGILYTPYLISKLGLSDYAIYNMAISVIAYFTIDFGIGAALTRYVARYRAEGCEDKIKNIIGLTSKLYLIIDVIIFIALLLLYYFSDRLFSSLSSYELERFKTVFLITSSFILISFPLLPLNGILLAYEKIVFIQTVELVSKCISVILLVFALYLGLGLFSVVTINSLVILSAQLLKLYLIHGKLGVGCDFSFYDKEVLQNIGTFSLWATVSTIADKFFFPIIPIILAAVSNTTQVAVFAIIAAIEGYVLTIARALNGIFLPKVMSHVVAKSDKEIITSMMIKVGRMQLYIVGMIIFAFFAFGRDFINYWVGSAFDSAYIGLFFVLVPCLFHLTMGIAEELVLAENKVKYRALIYVSGSVVNVIMIFILSPKLGAIGAAVAVFFAFVSAYNILAAIIYRNKFGINILRFFRECHLSIIPCFLVVFIFFLSVNHFWLTTTLCGLLIKIVFCVIVGYIILWVFTMNKEEKEIILSFIPNKLSYEKEKSSNC